MIIQQNIAQSFHSPFVRIVLVAIATGTPLHTLARSPQDSGKVVHSNDDRVHRHGRPADDHSAPAVLCEDTRRERASMCLDFTLESESSPDSSSLPSRLRNC